VGSRRRKSSVRGSQGNRRARREIEHDFCPAPKMNPCASPLVIASARLTTKKAKNPAVPFAGRAGQSRRAVKETTVAASNSVKLTIHRPAISAANRTAVLIGGRNSRLSNVPPTASSSVVRQASWSANTLAISV